MANKFEEKSEIYRFGDYILDAARRELRATGETWQAEDDELLETYRRTAAAESAK